MKELRWTQTSGRAFCRDMTVKCAQKSARLSYFGTRLPAILPSIISRIDEGKMASQTIEDIHALMAIT